MKVRIALAAAAVILETGSGSVLAQPVPAYPGVYPAPYPGAYPVLPPFEIVAIVRSKGFEPLGRPARQGPTYWVRAAQFGRTRDAGHRGCKGWAHHPGHAHQPAWRNVAALSHTT